MKYFNVCWLLIVITLSTSCTNSENGQTQIPQPVTSFPRPDLVFTALDSLKIPCEVANPVDLYSIHFLRDSTGAQTELVIADFTIRPQKRLNRFKWPSLAPLPPIVLEEQGPDGVGMTGMMSTGSFGTNVNQLFLLNSIVNKCFELDSSGKVIHQFRWDKETYLNLNPHIDTWCRPLEVHGNDQQWIIPIGDSYPMNQKGLQSKLPAVLKVRFNSSTRLIEVLDTLMTFPKPYDKGYYESGPFLYTPSLVWKTSGSLLVSFPIDHKVFEVDTSGNILATYNCRSAYVKDEIPPFLERDKSGRLPNRNHLNADVVGTYYWETNYYVTLMKVPGTPFYIRMVAVRPSEQKTEEHASTPWVPLDKFAIMILDENLRILNEQLFHTRDLQKVGLFYSDSLIYLMDSHNTTGEDGMLYYKGFSVREKGSS
jgi:hypothetical protein